MIKIIILITLLFLPFVLTLYCNNGKCSCETGTIYQHIQPEYSNGCMNDFNITWDNFTSACKSHTKCYSTCGNTKLLCDNVFCMVMNVECEILYENRDKCLEVAAYFCETIEDKGEKIYEEKQKKHCICIF